MKILLLNSTSIVKKLVRRLADIRGDQVFETEETGMDVVIVDDSVASSYPPEVARRFGRFTLYMGSRFDPVPSGYDGVLLKPFLPRELDELLSEKSSGVRSTTIPHAPLEKTVQNTVFNQQEIDEVKSLLESFDPDEEDLTPVKPEPEPEPEGVAEPEPEPEPQPAPKDDEEQIAAALHAIDRASWTENLDAVLYEAQEDDTGRLLKEKVEDYDNEIRHHGSGAAIEEPVEEARRHIVEEETPHSPMRELDEDALQALDLHARGVEALQDLMAILSDPSVAKALKTMGVRVEISFGEKS